MSSAFRNVAIVGRHDDPRVVEPLFLLARHLTEAGVKVFSSADIAIDIPIAQVAESQLAANVDLMIAIGGEGTMLYAGNLSS